MVVALMSLCPGARLGRAKDAAARGGAASSSGAGWAGLVATWRSLGRTLCLPCVYGPLLYNFLRGALVPSFGAAYFYFLTAGPGTRVFDPVEEPPRLLSLLPDTTALTPPP